MKDWTWVLGLACPECGFDASTCKAKDVSGIVRENRVEWRRMFESGAISAGRPTPSRWSSLEYACHVRDVYRRYDERIALMEQTDNPLFPNWDQDASAILERYDEQDPITVIAELESAADTVANRIDRIETTSWIRRGQRSDGAAFTIDSIVRYMVHDPIHHVWDVVASSTGGPIP